MWIRDMELVSGNIDCKRKHFVLEKQRSGDRRASAERNLFAKLCLNTRNVLARGWHGSAKDELEAVEKETSTMEAMMFSLASVKENFDKQHGKDAAVFLS